MHPKVEEYILQFPEPVRIRMFQIRALVIELVTEATEDFAYQMPAFKYKGKPFVYYAAFKNHIGFYALPSTHEHFKDALLKYKSGKGSVQFPLDQELPIGLIQKMIRYRLSEMPK